METRARGARAMSASGALDFRRARGEPPDEPAPFLVLGELPGIEHLLGAGAERVGRLRVAVEDPARVPAGEGAVAHEYRDEIVPLVAPLLDTDERFEQLRLIAVARRPGDERAAAVRIEAPAVHGVAVNHPVRRDVQVEKSFGLEDAQDLEEEHPEHLRVLE